MRGASSSRRWPSGHRPGVAETETQSGKGACRGHLASGERGGVFVRGDPGPQIPVPGRSDVPCPQLHDLGRPGSLRSLDLVTGAGRNDARGRQGAVSARAGL